MYFTSNSLHVRNVSDPIFFENFDGYFFTRQSMRAKFDFTKSSFTNTFLYEIVSNYLSFDIDSFLWLFDYFWNFIISFFFFG